VCALIVECMLVGRFRLEELLFCVELVNKEKNLMQGTNVSVNRYRTFVY
jgi:hypothetical protein